MEALQEQREPTGSKELHIFQPLDSLDKKVARDLLLSSLYTPHQTRSSESWRTGLGTKPPLLSKSLKRYKQLHQSGADTPPQKKKS